MKALLQQALEALEESNSEMRDLYFAHPSRQKNDAAIAALRTAIAQAAKPLTLQRSNHD